MQNRCINELTRSLYSIYVNLLKQERVQSLNIWKQNFVLWRTPCTSMRINEFSWLITCTSNLLQKASNDSQDAIVSLCIYCSVAFTETRNLCSFFRTFWEVHLNFDERWPSCPKVFLVKGALKICSKFTGERPCRSVVLIKFAKQPINHILHWSLW